MTLPGAQLIDPNASPHPPALPGPTPALPGTTQAQCTLQLSPPQGLRAPRLRLELPSWALRCAERDAVNEAFAFVPSPPHNWRKLILPLFF